MLVFTDLLGIPYGQTFTFLMDAIRQENGLFSFGDMDSELENYTISDQYFSLINFSPPDENLEHLICLAATVDPSVKYIIVSPVNCDSNISNSYVCNSAFANEFSGKVKLGDLG